jgi:hypothetical protein
MRFMLEDFTPGESIERFREIRGRFQEVAAR